MSANYYGISWAKRGDYLHMLKVVSSTLSAGAITISKGIYIPAQPDYLGHRVKDGRYISKAHLIGLFNNQIPNWRK